MCFVKGFLKITLTCLTLKHRLLFSPGALESLRDAAASVPLCHHCEETSARPRVNAAAVSRHKHHMLPPTKSSDSELPPVCHLLLSRL